MACSKRMLRRTSNIPSNVRGAIKQAFFFTIWAFCHRTLGVAILEDKRDRNRSHITTARDLSFFQCPLDSTCLPSRVFNPRRGSSQYHQLVSSSAAPALRSLSSAPACEPREIFDTIPSPQSAHHEGSRKSPAAVAGTYSNRRRSLIEDTDRGAFGGPDCLTRSYSVSR